MEYLGSLNERRNGSPFKKLLVVVVLLAAAYFGIKKWAPSALDRVLFWKKPAPVSADQLKGVKIETAPTPPPVPGPHPQPQPGGAPSKIQPVPGTPAPGTPVAVDKSAQVIVLLYERIEAEGTSRYRIAPDVLEQHLQRIKEAGLSIIPMQDFLAWRRGEKTIPPRSVLITVDGSFSSAYETARPLFKKHGVPWTLFVYVNDVSKGPKRVTWEQLGELRDEGVEIGSHGLSYDLNTADEMLRQQIASSKTTLEQKLGIRCAAFAYPAGAASPRARELVREAGYEAAFSVNPQRTTHAAPADRIARFAWNSTRPQDFAPVFTWGGTIQTAAVPDVVAAPPQEPAPAAPGAATPVLTQPLDGESVKDPQPAIRANLAPWGEFDPATVGVRLSGSGPLVFKWLDPEKRTLEARPPQPLQPGPYSVTISAKHKDGRRVETQWAFRFDPTGGHDNALDPAPKSPR